MAATGPARFSAQQQSCDQASAVAFVIQKAVCVILCDPCFNTQACHTSLEALKSFKGLSP